MLNANVQGSGSVLQGEGCVKPNRINPNVGHFVGLNRYDMPIHSSVGLIQFIKVVAAFLQVGDPKRPWRGTFCPLKLVEATLHNGIQFRCMA